MSAPCNAALAKQVQLRLNTRAHRIIARIHGMLTFRILHSVLITEKDIVLHDSAKINMNWGWIFLSLSFFIFKL